MQPVPWQDVLHVHAGVKILLLDEERLSGGASASLLHPVVSWYVVAFSDRLVPFAPSSITVIFGGTVVRLAMFSF